MRSTDTNGVKAGGHFGLLLLLGIAACTSPSGLINEDLDPMTSVTVTSSNTPLVFYQDNPSQAAYARNYLHLGPIEVNHSGSYRYYIWISAWSTMQTADPSVQRDRLESIIVFADAEPLALDLAGWTPEAIGTSESVYVKAVASAAVAYYEVTIDQIRLIAGASDIRLSAGSVQPDSYASWDNQGTARKSMHAFLDYAAH